MTIMHVVTIVMLVFSGYSCVTGETQSSAYFAALSVLFSLSIK